MKSGGPSYFSWARGRFMAVAGVLFVLQAGLIFLFGARPRFQLSSDQALSMHVRSLGASVTGDELLRQLFVGDPAVFTLPNLHGFSGCGWLDHQPPAYQAKIQLEPANPLALDTSRLGTNFPVLTSESETMPAILAEQQIRRVEPVPVFLALQVVSTQSVFRLPGNLGDRLLGAAPALRAWPSAKVLTNSSVQIAVDPAGEVIAARLETGCGLAAADAEAVADARTLRFQPAPSAGTQWGKAIFQWQTAELPAAVPPK